MKKIDSTSLLFDLNIFSKRKTQLLILLEKWLQETNQLHLICTPNSEQIIQSRGNIEFKQALQAADLLLPDGVGLVAAAKILSIFTQAKPVAERITGVGVARALLKMARRFDLEVLVIGGRDYSPQDYFAYHGAKIHWTPGFADVVRPATQEKKLLESKIKQLKPELVFVAFGAPAQELWLKQQHELLQKNGVRVAMVVGGSFDYLLGKVPRAPFWFRKLGLEWLFRLLVEPWRLKRQLRLISFMMLTLKTAFERKTRISSQP